MRPSPSFLLALTGLLSGCGWGSYSHLGDTDERGTDPATLDTGTVATLDTGSTPGSATGTTTTDACALRDDVDYVMIGHIRLEPETFGLDPDEVALAMGSAPVVVMAGYRKDGRISALRIHRQDDLDCAVNDSSTARALPILLGAGLELTSGRMDAYTEVLERHDLTALEDALAEVEALPLLPGLADDDPLLVALAPLVDGLVVASSARAVDLSVELEMVTLNAEDIAVDEPGVLRLSAELSGWQFEPVVVTVGGEEVIWLMPEDFPRLFAAILVDGRILTAGETGSAEISLSGLDHLAVDDVPLRVLSPGLADAWDLPLEDMVSSNHTVMAGLVGVMELAIQIVAPDLELDELATGDCGDALLEALEEVLGALVLGLSADSSSSGVFEAIVDAIAAFLTAAFEDPDDPGELGWLFECTDLVPEDAGGLDGLIGLLADIVDLRDRLETIATVSEFAVSYVAGPAVEGGDLELCALTECGPDACEWGDPGELTCTVDDPGTGSDGGSTDGGTSDGGTSDGGTSDGGSSDGGTSDGGTSDGGTSDGGTSDGGTSDGGTSDGGTSDGGTSDGSSDGGGSDGGSSDGGSTDGGSSDGGSSDGGSSDGGSTDGGSSDGGSSTVTPEISGVDCSSWQRGHSTSCELTGGPFDSAENVWIDCLVIDDVTLIDDSTIRVDGLWEPDCLLGEKEAKWRASGAPEDSECGTPERACGWTDEATVRGDVVIYGLSPDTADEGVTSSHVLTGENLCDEDGDLVLWIASTDLSSISCNDTGTQVDFSATPHEDDDADDEAYDLAVALEGETYECDDSEKACLEEALQVYDDDVGGSSSAGESVDGFDHPVGDGSVTEASDGDGWYSALSWTDSWSTYYGHCGTDWNDEAGGDSDYGDPVYAIAHGYITAADDYGTGWGMIITVEHWVEGAGDDAYEIMVSQYAHVSATHVAVGDWVERGDLIAEIGDADGVYSPHLHLELRWDEAMAPDDGGYGCYDASSGTVDPTEFIDGHRSWPS